MFVASRFAARLRNFRNQAIQLGWRRTTRLRIARRLGMSEIKVSVPGVRNRVSVRVGDSDIYDFTQSLGRERAPIDLGFEPRVIIDAGANVGYTVLRFASQFPNAKIIAVEPDANNVRQLKKNCRRCACLIVEQKAVWSHPARLRIINPHDASNAFVVKEDLAGTIEATSIGDLLRRHQLDAIDLLKIDIEGSEKEVFEHRNVQEWLPKIKALLIETHDNIRDGTQAALHRAVDGHMTFRAMVGEYEFYLAKTIP